MRRRPQQLCWVSESKTDDEDGEASCSERRRVLTIVESDDEEEEDLGPPTERAQYERADKDDDQRWADWEAFAAEVEDDFIARPVEHYNAGRDSTTEEGDFNDSSSSSDLQSVGRLLRSQTQALHSAPLTRFSCGAMAPVPMAPECRVRLWISHTQKPHGLALPGDAYNPSD